MSETPILKCADGAVISVALARIEDGLQVLTKETYMLRTLQETSTRRVEKIERELENSKITLSVRQELEDKISSRFRWWLVSSFAIAGTLAGIIFGSLQALAK